MPRRSRNTGSAGEGMSFGRLLRWFCTEWGRRERALLQGAVTGDALDLLGWGRAYLPEHFVRPPSAMHRWLADQCGAMHLTRGVKINLLGPRGSAKSTLGALAYPLCTALEGWEPYVWIVSDTMQQARTHLDNIKRELTQNPHLQAAYPESAGKGLVWRSGAIALGNSSVIEAFGTGQALRGRRRGAFRPTLIVCDDLQNDAHISSARQRDGSRAWFHATLLKAGTPRTNVINLATALHREALAVELLDNPGWISRVFPAIISWPANMPLWEEWETIYADVARDDYRQAARTFYDERRTEMDEGAEVLWPEEEDLYSLMCMRAESGRTAFEREKQNVPLNPEACEWPESYFGDGIWFDAWPERPLVRTLALDPSKGSDARRSDYSAYVALAVDAQGLLYAEADLGRRPTPEIVAQGVERYRRFAPDRFGVETNQFQELLAAEFEAEFLRQGLLGARPVAIDNRVNKQVRLRRLGPYLAARRLRFKSNSPSTRLLVEQLKEFPAGDHDDGPDALEMAIRLAGEALPAMPFDDGLGNRLYIE